MAGCRRVHWLPIVVLTACFGCSQEQAATDVPAPPVTLAYDGRTWEQVGPCAPERFARPGMTAMEYRTTEPNVRLVELTGDETSPPLERVNARIRRVQVLRGGRWVDDGLRVCEFRDGSRMETRMTLGVFGEQKEWDDGGEPVIFRGCADNFRGDLFDE